MTVAQPEAAACSCGSAIPVQDVAINGATVTLIALPAIFELLHNAGRQPSPAVAPELLAQVQIYNPIPAGQSAAYEEALLREYRIFCGEERDGQ